MKVLFKVSLILVLTLAAALVDGQNLTRSSVLNIKVTDTGVIYQKGDVKGYYFFYMLEKTSSNMANFLLTVVDENLNEINSVPITRPTSYNLLESAFNGSSFAFLFYDKKSKALDLTAYNIALKEPKTVLIKIPSAKARNYYAAAALNNLTDQRLLVPVDGKGFLHYSLGGKKGTDFAIEYYDDNLRMAWSEVSQPGRSSAIAESASEAFQHWPYAGSVITRSQGKDLTYSLIVHNVSTGQRVYRTVLTTAKWDITPTDVRYDSVTQECQVFGEYYNARGVDLEMKSQSRGFCNLTLAKDGSQGLLKWVSWLDMSKKAPVTEKGKVDGSNTFILFHDFIRTADGQVFAIGEQYKKAVSGAGVGLAALSVLAAAAGGYYAQPSSGMTQMNVYNIVIMQFNASHDIEKVHIFEKNKTTVQLPTGAMYVSPKSLTYMVKAAGGFDFQFSQVLPDKNTFACVFTDFEQRQSRGVMGTVAYTPEKTFAEDKIYINRRTANFTVWRAKPGYVLILEYLKKEKKLDMRLEKINY
jgi:hypothetical protein